MRISYGERVRNKEYISRFRENAFLRVRYVRSSPERTERASIEFTIKLQIEGEGKKKQQCGSLSTTAESMLKGRVI